MLSATLTWSRGGFLCIITVIIVTLYFNRKKVGSVVVLASVMLILVFWGGNFLMKSSSSQIDRLSSSSNFAARFFLWEKSAHVISENILLGVGFGNGPYAVFEEQGAGNITSNLFVDYNTIQGGRAAQTLHSFFLNWVVSMGVFIVPLILLIYYYCLSNLRLVIKNHINDSADLFAKASIAAIIGLTMFYIQNTSNTYYYLFFFLGASSQLAYLVKPPSMN